MSRPTPKREVWGYGLGGVPACTEVDPPQLMATAVGGTHPTGMHSFILQISCLGLGKFISVQAN